MCLVSSLFTAAGAGLEAFGNLYKGQAEADQKMAEARIYGLNADIAESNAEILRGESEITAQGAGLAESRALLQESRLRRAGREIGGAQRVEAVSRNIDPTSGSALLLAGRTAAEIQADIDITRATGRMEFADLYSRSVSIRSQAAGEAGRATSARLSAVAGITAAGASLTAGRIGAGIALLKGAEKIATKIEGAAAKAATAGAGG